MRWTLKRVKHGSDGSNTATEIFCTKELMVTTSLCSNFTCFFFSFFFNRIKASHVEWDLEYSLYSNYIIWIDISKGGRLDGAVSLYSDWNYMTAIA